MNVRDKDTGALLGLLTTAIPEDVDTFALPAVLGLASPFADPRIAVQPTVNSQVTFRRRVVRFTNGCRVHDDACVVVVHNQEYLDKVAGFIKHR